MRRVKQDTLGRRKRGFGLVSVLAGIAAILIACGATHAGEFAIVKLVKCDTLAQYARCKFSPKGTTVGLFIDSTFVTVDSAGHAREAIAVGGSPFQWDWLSEHEIVIHWRQRLGRTNQYKGIAWIDIESATIDTLYGYESAEARKDSAHWSLGLLVRTIAGRLCYTLGKNGAKRCSFPESKYEPVAYDVPLSEDGFVDWGPEGMYRISVDFKDSTRMGPFFGYNQVAPPLCNSNLTYSVNTSQIIRLSDSSIVELPASFRTPQGYSACEFWDPVFSPRGTELFFDWYCSGYSYEDGEKELRKDTYLFLDIPTGQTKSLNDLFRREVVGLPVFSLDGSKIAFRSDGKLFIACVRWQ